MESILCLVTHETVMRCSLLDYFHYSPEWFNSEPNMNYCSIRYISEVNGENIDNGYIYGGPKKKLVI